MLSEKVNNNITQTTVKLITCKLKDIFYNLINDMCDLYEREDNGDIPEEFLPLINKVRDCVHRISEELNKDLADRQDFIDELNALKTEYISAARPLVLQSRAAENITSYVEHMMACNTVKKEDDEEYHNISHMILEGVEHYLDEETDELGLGMSMALIAAKIPLRMTREKYCDKVREGIKGEVTILAKDNSGDVVPFIEFNCFPQLCEGYRDMFGENAEEIDTLYNEDIGKYDEEQLDKFATRAGEVFDRVFETCDSINIAYNDINYMLALCAYASNEEFLTDDDPIIRDALYSCREMLESDMPELIYETLGERMVDLIEKNFAKTKELNDKFSEYSIKYDKSEMSTETQNLMDLYNYINTLYYLEISDETYRICRAEESLRSDDPTEELINMVGEINKRYPAAKSKYFRKQIFNYIPLIMSKKEFIEYYTYCIDPHNPTAESKAALVDVFELLNLGTSYFKDEDFDEEDCELEEHMHHHDDHCGCGHHHHHHHHHDDHCGCGHHHEG